jgi:uncharacterized protein (TIGR00255 family)
MILFSMTGYGESRFDGEDFRLQVEMRSVNHRFLEINCKLPSQYLKFEREIEKLIKSKLKRGKVDVFVSRRALSQKSETKNTTLRFDKILISNFVRELEDLFSQSKNKNEIIATAVSQFLSRKEVLDLAVVEEEVSNEVVNLTAVVEKALDGLVKQREVEGGALKIEFNRLQTQAEKIFISLQDLASSQPLVIQNKLEEKIKKLVVDVTMDPQRLAEEVAYLVERADITEELARLDSHLKVFKKTLSSAEGGRKLEFILQEMGREINTIGSKYQDIGFSPLVVEFKAVVEKIREQVQNVE